MIRKPIFISAFFSFSCPNSFNLTEDTWHLRLGSPDLSMESPLIWGGFWYNTPGAGLLQQIQRWFAHHRLRMDGSSPVVKELASQQIIRPEPLTKHKLVAVASNHHNPTNSGHESCQAHSAHCFVQMFNVRAV